jgi:sugar/nucleoside kinase (ribokinase family)
MEVTNVIVIGDINVDIFPAGHLPRPFTDPKITTSIQFSNLSIRPGGTSFNIALACIDAGFLPCICAIVGDDFAGRFLREEMDRLGIYGIYKNSEYPTGIAILLWDAIGKRLVINSDDNANHDLDSQHFESCLHDNPGVQLMFINGYSLRRTETKRYATIMDFLNHRDRKDATFSVIFDLVPHDLYKVLPASTFELICSKCDALSFEIATIRRFLKLGYSNEQIDETVALETILTIRNMYPHLSLLGFFGDNACGSYVRMLYMEETSVQGKIDVPLGSSIKGISDRMMVIELSALRNLKPLDESLSFPTTQPQ